MEIMTVFYVVVYFTIGCFLSDWLNTEDNDDVAMFIFLFWPLIIAILVIMLVLAFAMFISALVSKLMSMVCIKHDADESEGGDSSGAV